MDEKKEETEELQIDVLKTQLISRAEYFLKNSINLKNRSMLIKKEETRYILSMFSGMMLQLSEIYNSLHFITEIIDLNSRYIIKVWDRTVILADRNIEAREFTFKIAEIIAKRIEDFEKYVPLMESGLRQLEKLDEER